MAASRSNDEVDKDHRNIINSTLKHQFFTWHYIHGYSIDQISELLNRLLEQVHTRISKPVTKTMLINARRRWRDEWKVKKREDPSPATLCKIEQQPLFHEDQFDGKDPVILDPSYKLRPLCCRLKKKRLHQCCGETMSLFEKYPEFYGLKQASCSLSTNRLQLMTPPPPDPNTSLSPTNLSSTSMIDSYPTSPSSSLPYQDATISEQPDYEMVWNKSRDSGPWTAMARLPPDDHHGGVADVNAGPASFHDEIYPPMNLDPVYDEQHLPSASDFHTYMVENDQSYSDLIEYQNTVHHTPSSEQD